MRISIPALILTLGFSVQAEDTFLEGFPDVPYLDVIRAVEGEPVIFDTPSGTVAETTLQLATSGANAMELYRESLSALGWTCDSPALALTCSRYGNRLSLKSPNPSAQEGTLILRLEPIS